MASILIDNGNLVVPQPKAGAKLQYLQDGTITGSCKFGVRLSTAGSGTAIGTAHPYNSLALCSESEVEYNESDAEISSNYIGVWSSAVQKVSTVAGVASQQISQCPNWNNVGAAGIELYKVATFDPTTGAFNGFPPLAVGTLGIPGTGPTSGANIPPNTTLEPWPNTIPYHLGGVTGFLQGTTTIRISYSASSSSTVTSALAKMGTVLTSLVAGQITYSYSYYAFICTSVTYEETPFGTGSAQWTITEEYLVHNDGVGFDAAIYT